MLRNAPLLELGRFAFDAKRARFGNNVTYIVNRHVNPTNLCVYSCRFCDFAARRGDSHAYSLAEDDILASLADPGVQEVHLVGGLWPEWGLDRSLQLVRRILDARPDLWIKAFTAVEVAYFARAARRTTRDILAFMIDAGVNQMPGGGAEVLSERLHQLLFKQKIGPEEWLRIHEEAHDLGLSSNCTLLFGHLETDEEIVEHLFRLRASQDRTGGFQSFIPLSYQPGETKLVPRLASAPRCLRVVALARLVLDNIPHIKAYWPTLQIETAAAALTFGADDLDGTLGAERIMHAAGSATPAQLSTALMQEIILQAGQTPVQRTGCFAQPGRVRQSVPSIKSIKSIASSRPPLACPT
ncbi:MAG: CofH family radical SAM protein [Candidatus Hydrogenedentes bacterium]|nr:CofH family radical SAM protein [Candidatus Hydrogenedentota bacterium]